MATLDQILLRLPRQVPDADFVDRLFRQIRDTGISAPTLSITDLDLCPPEPEWIEPIQLDMQEEAEFTQTDANLYPPPVMQKESSSDIYQFTKFSP